MLFLAIPSQPATSNGKSIVYDVSGSFGFNAEFSQAGGSSIDGTAAVMGSNDIPPYGASPGTGWTPTNWTPWPAGGGGVLSQVISTPGFYPMTGGVPFKWLQLTWTFVSGSGGTISANLFTQDGSILSG